MILAGFTVWLSARSRAGLVPGTDIAGLFGTAAALLGPDFAAQSAVLRTALDATSAPS